MLHPGGGRALLWWTRRRECRPSLQLSSEGLGAGCSSATENSGTDMIQNGRCLKQSLNMGVIIWKVTNESLSAFNFKYLLSTALQWQMLMHNIHTRALWHPQKHCTALAHKEKVYKNTLHWANFSDLMQKFSTFTLSSDVWYKRNAKASARSPRHTWAVFDSATDAALTTRTLVPGVSWGITPYFHQQMAAQVQIPAWARLVVRNSCSFHGLISSCLLC